MGGADRAPAVLVGVRDAIGTITLNRPDQLNAINRAMSRELIDAIDGLDGDPAVRAVILTGSGEAFCAGADLSVGPATFEPARSEDRGSTTRRDWGGVLVLRLFAMNKPVIAAVNGAAVGGGFAFALACDIRFASSDATFGAVFIKRGVSACDMGTSYLLPRLVGASRAAELMLTGRVFDAAEAREMGLVLDVVAPGAVVDRALQTARLIVANGPLAVWMTKETMWQTIDAPSYRHALDMENRTQVMCTATGELTEAFAAFREGRPARWQPL